MSFLKIYNNELFQFKIFLFYQKCDKETTIYTYICLMIREVVFFEKCIYSKCNIYTHKIKSVYFAVKILQYNSSYKFNNRMVF